NGPAPALTVMRFNPDGSVDNMFGQQGVASAAVHGMGGNPVGLALVDGKIVVGAGSYFNTSFDASTLLMRLNMDGTFDGSFNGGSTLGGVVKSDGVHPVVLDRNVSVYDAELANRGDYGGSSVTLARHGGASTEDLFSAAGEVSFENGRVKVAGTDIGWVEQSGGTLTLHFGYGSQGMVERALHGIAYANASSSPASSVVIDWTFREGGDSASLAAFGSTTVQIGVQVQESVRAWVDPAKAADGRALAEIPYLATVYGTARGDTVGAGLLSTASQGLVEEFKHGVKFDTGAGDDVITGSAYGDLFIAGAGTNRIDGGTNLGTDPAGAAAVDILDVFVADAAAAAGVAPVALSASMTGADLDAFNAGFTYKVVAGGETDYLKGIEAVRVWVWDDKDGDGVRDVSSDAAVNEVTLVGTQTIPPAMS
ncbi:MAG TPA: delta-60 repeat domain-containing protein, partial [Telluria sp.]|nr:delta-60 repeat domain-containing protein [Telluria sp.]